MQLKLFTIPILGGEKLTEELNIFLRSKKILEVKDRIERNGESAFWCFCVKYLEGDGSSNSKRKRQKIDYKDILDEASFRRFCALRVTRKRVSDEDGVPAYVVFNDEQMAELAKVEVLTLSAMKKVKGIGEKTVERYGHHFIAKKENEKNE